MLTVLWLYLTKASCLHKRLSLTKVFRKTAALFQSKRGKSMLEQGWDQGWTARLSKTDFSFLSSNMSWSLPSKAPLPPGWTIICSSALTCQHKTPAPTGRNTEVHNRNQTLDLPLSSGPAGTTNPNALHSSPYVWVLALSWSEHGMPCSALVLATWHLTSSAGSSS